MTKLIAYLRLVRIPNVFTVPGNALAGAALALVGTQQDVLWRPPLLAALAGCLIYLGGMAFNDVFDRSEDLRERPTRPIPSGQISVAGAVILGLLLHAAGIAAARSALPAAGQCAGLLVVATFAYNGVLKNGPLGALSMGLCRALNLLMGAFAVGWLGETPAPAVAALLLGLYVVAITRAAQGEVTGADATAAGKALERFLAVIAGGVAMALMGLLPAAVWAVVPLALLAAVLLRAATRLAQAPTGANVGGLIKTSVFGIVLLDVAFLWAAGALVAGGLVCLLLIPAWALGRYFYST